MTFLSKFFRSFTNSSNISYGQNLLDGRALFNGFVPHPPRSAMPQSGTLTQAELQRVVADMVG